jgi:pimeloyl-ACP methyl ester carboxylesterase
VFVSGVFHHDAWALGAIDLDDETKAGFREFHAEVSPDGPGAFDVLDAKLDRMHHEEPTLTVADLAGYPGPALIMIGDDEDEIPLDHVVALRTGLPDAQLAVVPAAGHGLPLDRPELFTLLVTEFVTTVER